MDIKLKRRKRISGRCEKEKREELNMRTKGNMRKQRK